MTSARAEAPWRRWVLASGEGANNLTWQSIELFLLFFYTDVLGVSPLWAGYIFALGSLCDAVADPLVAALADRTASRWGRFRPWIAASAPVIGLCLIAAFSRPAFAEGALVAWALGTHLLLRAVYMTGALPFLSLTTRAVADARERATLSGLRMQFAALAGLAVSLVYPLALARHGVEAQAHAFQLCAAGLAGMAVAIYAAVVLVVREPPTAQAAHGAGSLAGVLSADVHAFWRIARRNGACVRVILAIVVISICMTMISKTTVYYFKYVLHAPQLVRPQLVLGALTLILTAPLWAAVARRFSKKLAWNVAAAIACTALALLYVNPFASPYVAMALLWLASLGSAGFAVTFWAMLPDTVEVNELLFGARDDAKVFALALFARKLALAFNAVLIGWAMTAAGYRANVAAGPSVAATLKILIAAVPLAGAALSVVILRGYRLDAEVHGRVRAELAARATGSAPTELVI